MQDDVVRLLTAIHPAQAHLWRVALEEDGIQAKVVGDYLNAGLGDISGAGAELWVHRDDAERAMAIIDAHPENAGVEEEES